MKKIWKKGLSLLLAGVMLFGVMPVSVIAEKGDSITEADIFENKDSETVTEKALESWIAEKAVPVSASGSAMDTYRYRVAGSADDWEEFQARLLDYYTKTIVSGTTYEVQRQSRSGNFFSGYINMLM